jgi:hypothetical protein
MEADPQSVRAVVGEKALIDMSHNLRHYETYMIDSERDDSIFYARSLITRLDEGYSLEWVVATLVAEIPVKDYDIVSLVPLMNYFLNEAGKGIQFDDQLNIYNDDGALLLCSDDVVEGVSEKLRMYLAQRQTQQEAAYFHFAEMVSARLINGFPLEMLMPLVKDDIVTARLDNKVVAEQVNCRLEAAGSSMRVNDYFEIIYVLPTDEDID